MAMMQQQQQPHSPPEENGAATVGGPAENGHHHHGSSNGNSNEDNGTVAPSPLIPSTAGTQPHPEAGEQQQQQQHPTTGAPTTDMYNSNNHHHHMNHADPSAMLYSQQQQHPDMAPAMTGSYDLSNGHHHHLDDAQQAAQLAALYQQPPQEHEDGLGDVIDDNDGSNELEEEEPLKLFVGQVPKQMSEEDIFPTFDTFGPLKDVAIIRDKHTGLHRGCAFVTFWSSADAIRAQQALHDKFSFPGAKRPAQVKPAEPTGSFPENKLFIGMLSRTATEEDVRELFAPFGEIREIHMIRSSDGTSRCAAFLRFMKREAAVAAIERLNNNNVVMEGASRPLIVKFADNKHQRHQRHIRNMRKQEMLMTGGMNNNGGGRPPYHGGYQNHGPPHVAMGPTHPHPAASGSHFSPMPPYPGHPYYAGPPPNLHPYMYQQPQPPFPPAPSMYGAPPEQPPPPQPQQQPPAPVPPPQAGGAAPQQSQPADGAPNAPRPREGPAGANLFVYHLPHDLTDADLATAFNSFGNVISAKVYVDKYTGESKGFGFVSYDSVISAEAAIEQMNGFQIGNKRLKVQHKRVHGMNPNLPVHNPNTPTAANG
eukprot:CAMPEP_0172468190 /NCGR_PEP_ID=MMETSP1065-20121228/60848_1 /TAXON_ID=265537 /ORGANISM="Amphiprora paludosa, Strain CCMP125" /LENGTH=592 /DNA_ID=CAMNT_0013225543 /DNA_START=53 /DNA_END=1831 /DNA_ORIENTATION=-